MNTNELYAVLDKFYRPIMRGEWAQKFEQRWVENWGEDRAAMKEAKQEVVAQQWQIVAGIRDNLRSTNERTRNAAIEAARIVIAHGIPSDADTFHDVWLAAGMPASGGGDD